MALDAKISALPAVTTPASTDELPCVQGGITKKQTRAQLHTLESGETLTLGGDLDHDGTNVGFYGTAPIAKQTGVAVTDAAIHAALVALGLFDGP